MEFSEAMKARRTYYGIGPGSPVSDERIKQLVEEAVMHVPSAFNMQSARVIVLFGEAHLELWRIAVDALREVVPEEQFPDTEKKIQSFAAGHGTVLFYDDTKVTAEFADQYDAYRDNFPIWAQQSNGMLQFAIWTLLEQEGLGVNLQHYNPLIDIPVSQTWNIPEHWRLIAQMPFGERTEQPEEKTFEPLDRRVRIIQK